MESHTEHTGMSGRHKPAHFRLKPYRGITQDPSFCFPRSCLTILTPDLTISLEEITHHGTWGN